MKKKFLVVLMTLMSLTSFAQQIKIVKSQTVPRGYLEFLPAGYTPTQLYSCIIFLHGSGERGDGSAEQLDIIKKWGPPKFINSGSTMCFTVNGKEECFIVLSPQQSTSRWGWQGDVIPFVKYALKTYSIDPNRIYVTGLSMGGDGSWDTSYDGANNPNIIQAIAPVSGKGDYNGAKETASKKINVWAFHGDKDTSVPIADGKRPINGMNSVSANPAPIWTLVPGGTHSGSTWDKVYSPTHDYFNPNVYEWFLTKGIPTVLPPVVSLDSVKLTYLNQSGDSVIHISKSGRKVSLPAKQ